MKMQIEKGSTRTVMLTGRRAFKMPRLCGWENFLTGLLANLQERKFGRSGLEGFCPVRFSDPFGLLVVMPRCEPLTDAEWCSLDLVKWRHRETHFIFGEDKRDGFGTLNGEIVTVDYG